MKIVESIDAVREALGADHRGGVSIGLVPTMGALHDGHWSLIDRAAAECRTVVVTIFVNPLQFGDGEDWDTYPNTREADLAGCRARGVGLVFAPRVEAMYPGEVLTEVRVDRLSAPACGRHRPGHFAGVCNVVAKLLNIVQPTRAYFGEKDYQQLAVLRRMVCDLSLPVTLVGCPIIREPDGLAMSSRNAYLTPEQRAAAPMIHRSLVDAVEAVRAGERSVDRLVRQVADEIEAGGADSVEYVELLDASSLEPLTTVDRPARMLVAVRFGASRLIDNIAVDAAGGDR